MGSDLDKVELVTNRMRSDLDQAGLVTKRMKSDIDIVALVTGSSREEERPRYGLVGLVTKDAGEVRLVTFDLGRLDSEDEETPARAARRRQACYVPAQTLLTPARVGH
eukprot:1121053-Rhodomonas_salina.1